MANNYTLGRGKAYFDPFDGNGNTTGERYLGNCPGLEISLDSESLEHFSSESGIQEKDDEVLIRVVRNANLTCDNMSEENTALFIIGTVSTVNQTNTPVVDEALTVKQGHYYQLGTTSGNPVGVRGVTSVVVTGTGGTPTYTLTTDYTVDATLGRLYIVPGGGIADGTAILVDYTPDTNSRTRVTAQSLAAVEGAFRFIADNPKGTNRDFYAPKVQLKPTGQFALIGEDWMQMGFTVEFLKKDTSTAALFVDGRPA